MAIDNESDAAADMAGRRHVESLQRRLPDWWLMYSLHGRSLVAFYKGPCSPGGIRVEARHPEDLLQLMSDAVLTQWKAQPAAAHHDGAAACLQGGSSVPRRGARG